MPSVATGRKYLSELVKGADNFGSNVFSDFSVATAAVKGSGDVEPIGTLMKFNASTSAFNVLTVPDDWEAATTYAMGDIVKPTTRNGFEYVCVKAGATHATTEPTWPLADGGQIVDNVATWLARIAYTGENTSSTLPNKADLAISIGSSEGAGFNKEDVTLSSTAVNMTLLYRGKVTIIDDEIEWGSIAAADQAEIKVALERANIHVEDAATAVTPTYLS